MSKPVMYLQQLANTNGSVNSNVSTQLLPSYLKVNIVFIKIAGESMELWLILVNIENLNMYWQRFINNHATVDPKVSIWHCIKDNVVLSKSFRNWWSNSRFVTWIVNALEIIDTSHLRRREFNTPSIL